MRQLGSEFVAFVSKFFVEIGPEGRWLYFAVENTAFYSLILLTLLSFLSDLRPGFGQKSKTLNIIQARWVFSLILFVFVVMSKFPTAMIGHLNPDEELWIACAKTMMQDPRPWLECDTSTSGPLVILPLIVLKFFGIPIDVGSTRLASGIVFALSVVFAFQAYTNIFGKSLGRLAIIPLSAALGLGTSFFWDFIPYNGEQDRKSTRLNSSHG